MEDWASTSPKEERPGRSRAEPEKRSYINKHDIL
jgi:hypothetical protein